MTSFALKTTTLLSHLGTWGRAARCHLRGMARSSQRSAFVCVSTLLAPLFTTGCIIAEAPEYGEPQRTPIFMSDPTPSPANLQLLVTTTPPLATSFQVTVRSEDAGDRLHSALYVDYKHRPPKQSLMEHHSHPASTFSIPRPITYLVSPESLFFTGAVCHSLTLMVMHESSWDDTAQVPKGAPEDLAQMTWFVSVNDINQNTLLSRCPTVDSGSQ
jgi:hypothetical protein